MNDLYIGQGNPVPTNGSTQHLSIDRTLRMWAQFGDRSYKQLPSRIGDRFYPLTISPIKVCAVVDCTWIFTISPICAFSFGKTVVLKVSDFP